MATDYDSWRDREDRRLGAQGHGPYADFAYGDCACCGERAETPDLYEVGTGTDVYICGGCFGLLCDGDLVPREGE